MRIRIVDAFTDRPFAGNPAGVLLLDSFPDDDWLQNVAREVNHAETAFAHRLPEGGEADWALRWFTPATEVALCGHATLATAHVLHTTGAHEGPVRFATRSGVLRAAPHEDGSVTLDPYWSERLGRPDLTGLQASPRSGRVRTELRGDRTLLTGHAVTVVEGELLA
jgi:predicted PhzF superfamily epimerase YddE/YHI9